MALRNIQTQLLKFTECLSQASLHKGIFPQFHKPELRMSSPRFQWDALNSWGCMKLLCSPLKTRVIFNFLSLYGSMALGRFFSFLSYTQSVGLPGWRISSLQGCYLHTWQHKHKINTYTHPYLEWDLNPQPQCLSERRLFTPQTVRPLGRP
jgi:hypothetical protein